MGGSSNGKFMNLLRKMLDTRWNFPDKQTITEEKRYIVIVPGTPHLVMTTWNALKLSGFHE